MSLCLLGGCGSSSSQTASDLDEKNSDLDVFAQYSAEKISIMPLTKFVGVGAVDETERIKLYVALLDAFGSQRKTPGVFRFEMYEYIERSGEQKGKRIVIWPDIDLVASGVNNEYWQDFFRAYKFDLDFEPQMSKSYVLQVTCMIPNGKRLTAEFILKP
jgi:hypothetical protein